MPFSLWLIIAEILYPFSDAIFLISSQTIEAFICAQECEKLAEKITKTILVISFLGIMSFL